MGLRLGTSAACSVIRQVCTACPAVCGPCRCAAAFPSTRSACTCQAGGGAQCRLPLPSPVAAAALHCLQARVANWLHIQRTRGKYINQDIRKSRWGTPPGARRARRAPPRVSHPAGHPAPTAARMAARPVSRCNPHAPTWPPVHAHRGYRNPEFFAKMVEHLEIDQYGTSFAPEVRRRAARARRQPPPLCRAWCWPGRMLGSTGPGTGEPPTNTHTHRGAPSHCAARCAHPPTPPHPIPRQVFDPKSLPKEDYLVALQREWAAEEERRKAARAAGQGRVEFHKSCERPPSLAPRAGGQRDGYRHRGLCMAAPVGFGKARVLCQPALLSTSPHSTSSHAVPHPVATLARPRLLQPPTPAWCSLLSSPG